MKKNLSLRKYFILILSISLFFITLGLFAFKAGEEFQVNTYTAGDQYNPTAAMDKKGNFVVVWKSDDQDGALGEIYAQRFNKQGKAIGTEFRVNTYTIDDQRNPGVAMNSKGDFVIAWESLWQDGLGWGIFAQRFNKNGKPVGLEFQVNTYVDYSQTNPVVAIDDKGNFVIAWESGSGIYAQRFDNKGQPVGPEFKANTASSASDPAIAIVKKRGNFIITYRDSSDDALAQRFNKNGKALGAEFKANTSYAPFQWFPAAIATDKKGNFVITWQSEEQGGDGVGVLAQRFNKNGKALGSEIQVNTNTDEWQDKPVIVMDDKGNFVIAWYTYWYDGSGEGVFAQRFNKFGKALGSEFQVNTYALSNQQRPAMAIDGKGNFVITWESLGQDGSGYGIFAKMFKK